MISKHPDGPVLNGLVLAGGRSSRMGHDKSRLRCHGDEQRYHLARLLRPWCRDVFLSCRAEQMAEITPGFPVITDAYEGLGPYGALLSAFGQDSSCAWLVVACDLLLLGPSTLDELLEGRDPAMIASTFESPHDGLPEPLLTIWEPASYPLLLSGLEAGYRCPRKVLIRHGAKLLKPGHPEELLNANTPGDLEQALQFMKENPRQYAQ